MIAITLTEQYACELRAALEEATTGPPLEGPQKAMLEALAGDLSTRLETAKAVQPPTFIVQRWAEQYAPELTLERRGERWEWAFRCVTSEETPGGENGFGSALEALAHFAGDVVRVSDEMARVWYGEDEGSEDEDMETEEIIAQ